jgi:hypothetical protein
VICGKGGKINGIDVEDDDENVLLMLLLKTTAKTAIVIPAAPSAIHTLTENKKFAGGV